MSGRLGFEAHGLRFAGPIPPLGLRASPAQGPADIEMSLGPVPASLGRGARLAGRYEIAGDRVLLRLPGGMRCLVEDGARITLLAGPGADPGIVRAYLSGIATGVALHQRGLAPLHGACVARDGRGLILMGASGAGKSTTAAMLAAEGFGIVCDDVSVVEWREGAPFVPPSGRAPKLWEDAAAALGLGGESDDGDAAGAVAEYAGLAKRVLPAEGEAPPAPRLAAIFLLSWLHPDDGPPELRRLAGIEAVRALRANFYLEDLPGPLGREGACLAQAARILAAVPVYALARPRAAGRMEEAKTAILRAAERAAC